MSGAELRVATLCDVANVRDGLLNVLGGGISILNRSAFPASIHAYLVLLLDAIDVDDVRGFAVNVDFHELDNPEKLAESIKLRGEVKEPMAPVDHPTSIPFVIPLDAFEIGRPGRYEIRISGEQGYLGRVRFDATLLDNPQL